LEPTYSIENISIKIQDIKLARELIINEKPKQDFYICKLCNGIVREAKCCNNCDDLFCKICLEETLNLDKNQCPACNESPFVARKINKIINQTINDLELRCPYGCNQIIKYENIESHLKLCDYASKLYKCDLCNEKIKIENGDSKLVISHNEKCPNLLIRCSFCSLDIKKSYFDIHLNECMEMLIYCEKCLIPFRKKFNEAHSQFYCNKISNIKESIFTILDQNLEK